MIPERACYDLGEAPASWDFVTWLVRAEQAKRAAGIEASLKVAFKPGPNEGFRHDGLPLTIEQRKGMLANVLRPALSLVGAYETDDALEGCRYPYVTRPIVEAYWQGEQPPKLLEGRGDPTGPVVITLREADYWPSRNAVLGVWLAFAERLEAQGEHVIFVRDTAKADEPMTGGFETAPSASRSLLERVALMERAKVNIMLNNGPTVLAINSEIPYLILKPLASMCPATTASWWSEMIGVPVGAQYPWAREAQRIVWAPDQLSVLEVSWRELPIEKALEAA